MIINAIGKRETKCREQKNYYIYKCHVFINHKGFNIIDINYQKTQDALQMKKIEILSRIIINAILKEL